MQPARKRSTALFALAAGLFGGWAGFAADDGAARIVAVREITGDLAVAGGTIAVGGISDLFLEGDRSGGNRRLWAVTDRGPNGIVEVEHDSGKVKRRTILAPEFVPSLILLDAAWLCSGDHEPAEIGTAAVKRVVPLKGRSGRPLSGRPNGLGRDESVHSADGSTRLATDPDGVDTEGVVAAGDGGFWLVEEYRPSILRVGADGTLLTRHVPAGDALPGAQAHVVANLPIRYAGRAHNRGFEAVAITPDHTRLFALLQSPLAEESAGRSVPLIVIDTASGKPAAEHEYLLDKADADGKLCAMAYLGPATLLVLEQADDGLARLYRVDTGAAPIRKTLVADLGPLLPAMIAHVFGKPTKTKRALKIEGLAVVDASHVLLANDNDFGVADSDSKAKAGPRSCLWLIELPTPLPLESNT